MHRIALLTAVFSLSSGASALAQVAWQSDLTAARAEARQSERVLLVVVHAQGDRTCAEAWKQIWTGRRFTQHAKLDVVPVLVALPGGGHGDAPVQLPIEPKALIAHSWAASRELFGVGAAVTAPQFLVMHHDGTVFAQHLGACTEAELTRAIERGRADRKLSVKARGAALRTQLERLRRDAPKDPGAAERLAVILRNAPVETFGELAEALSRDARQAPRWLAESLAGQPLVRAAALCDAISSCKACAALSSGELESHRVVGQRESIRDVFAPLAEVRPRPALEHVQFCDGRARRCSDLTGKPTVLLFFLPDAADLRRQLDAVVPLVRELEARGVASLALFATLHPTEDLPKVAALELPCPAGTYAYADGAPWAGVRQFPASMVLDEDRRVVFVADGPGERAYGEFAPTARGLARFLSERPKLVRPVRS